MKSGWDLKGRNFEYVGPLHEHEPDDLPCVCPEAGHLAIVLEVRADARGTPHTVLVRTADIVTWMSFTVFNSMYAQIVPEAPVKRGRRTTQAPAGDELDDLWGQVMKDAA